LRAATVKNQDEPQFRAQQIKGIPMDIISAAAVSTFNSTSRLRTAVELNVLKKAIDIQAAGALALVQAVPAPPAAAPGGAVDTWA
jgi:hypothetical protein